MYTDGIRRFITQRSQTTLDDALGVSSAWIHEHFRAERDVKAIAPAPSTSNEPSHGEETKSKGGGGAWRAFVRLMHSSDLRAVAERYKIGKADS